MQGARGALWPAAALTSSSTLAQLFVLDEAGEHLRVHEELQELPHAPRRVRLAEAVALQLPAAAGRLGHVERVVSHQLHEEADEALRDQRAQVSLLTCRQGDTMTHMQWDSLFWWYFLFVSRALHWPAHLSLSSWLRISSLSSRICCRAACSLLGRMQSSSPSCHTAQIKDRGQGQQRSRGAVSKH